MPESLIDFDRFIYDEMMTHPVLFTHPAAKKIALIHCSNGILHEVLKHSNLAEIWLIQPKEVATAIDSRLQHNLDDINVWLQSTETNTFDIIIVPDIAELHPFTTMLYQQLQRLLTTDGILVCHSDSHFKPARLKSTYHAMQQAGFQDLQIMNFPQPNSPSGVRAAILAIKNGAFRRIREKDIFNKSFTTRYYNFDVHRAAFVMPEFLRSELEREH